MEDKKIEKMQELGKLIVQQNRERLTIRKLIRRSLNRKKLALHPKFRQKP